MIFIKKLSFSRKRLLFILVFSHVALLLVCLLYRHMFFSEGAIEFDCPFYNAFGFGCPGCGGSRSLVALLDLNLIKSFLLYPPLLITCFFILEVDIRAAVSFFKNSPSTLRAFNPTHTVIIPISILLNFFVRVFFYFCFRIDLVSLAAAL